MINKLSLININHNKNLTTYINLITNLPILSKQQELDLAKLIKIKHNKKAATLLITYNLKFVIFLAYKFNHYGFMLSDLIQEGNLALIKSLPKFNPYLGVRFISFAIYWIKAAFYNYIMKNWRIVNIATTKHQKQIFFALSKYKQQLTIDNPTIINMKSKLLTKDISLDSNNNSLNYNEKLIYTLTDHNDNFFIKLEQHNWKKFLLNKLKLSLNKLDKRSKYIIYIRWLNHKKYSLITLANIFKISIERIRQLEKKALTKLRYILNNEINQFNNKHDNNY